MRYKRAISPTAKEPPSHHLGVEVSNYQYKVLQVTYTSALTKREVVNNVSGKGVSMRLTAQKIDSLGSIKPYSGSVNDEENLTKGRNQVLIYNFIADIEAQNKSEHFQKKSSDASALVLLATDAR